MKKILFCQFHNFLINGKNNESIADKYYSGIYTLKEKDGYYKNDAFFELPLWINEVNGSLSNSAFNRDLLIIDNLKFALYKINRYNPDYILFSVLDVNKNYILDIIKNYRGNGKIILGGYIDFKDFKDFKNVFIFNDVKSFITSLGINYKYDLNYKLFKNYKTIPRLTLSKGCLNKCKFCTVEKNLVTMDKKNIIRQIKAFKELDFKLVYLNDKTFGQAKNYYLLPMIYKHIKKYNSEFKGFIIQTTASQVLNKSFTDFLKNAFIFACELGVESYNDNILKALNKPHNTLAINKATDILKNNKIKVIYNLIIGLLPETKITYNNTLNFIAKRFKDIYLLNVYNLALYSNSELAKSIVKITDNDKNERSLDKSFYNKKQINDNKYFYDKIFKIGIKLLNK